MHPDERLRRAALHDRPGAPSPSLDAELEAAALVPLAQTPPAPAEPPPTLRCPFCEREFAAERCPACGWKPTLDMAAAMDELRRRARLGYILMAATPLCGLTPVAALVVAYANRGDSRGTWLESHFDWQIETFWKTVGYGVLAVLVAGAGALLLGDTPLGRAPEVMAAAALVAWYVHRVVKGWTRLSDDERVTEY